jgi:hypothetical protein
LLRPKLELEEWAKEGYTCVDAWEWRTSAQEEWSAHDQQELPPKWQDDHQEEWRAHDQQDLPLKWQMPAGWAAADGTDRIILPCDPDVPEWLTAMLDAECSPEEVKAMVIGVQCARSVQDRCVKAAQCARSVKADKKSKAAQPIAPEQLHHPAKAAKREMPKPKPGPPAKLSLPRPAANLPLPKPPGYPPPPYSVTKKRLRSDGMCIGVRFNTTGTPSSQPPWHNVDSECADMSGAQASSSSSSALPGVEETMKIRIDDFPSREEFYSALGITEVPLKGQRPGLFDKFSRRPLLPKEVEKKMVEHGIDWELP